MSSHVPGYSLLPLTMVDTTYLLLDRKTKAEKGFALLTRARQEGDRFELRELNLQEQLGMISQLVMERFAGQHPSEDLTAAASSTIDECDSEAADLVTNYDEGDRETSDTVTNSAMMTAPMSVKELVAELMFKCKMTTNGFDEENYKHTKPGAKIMRKDQSETCLTTSVPESGSMADEAFSEADSEDALVVAAQTTAREMVAELLDMNNEKLGSASLNSNHEPKPRDPILPCVLDHDVQVAESAPERKSKKQSKADSAGFMPDGSTIVKTPRSCLKLPSGWNNLNPSELALQIKTVNSVDEDSPENRRIASLVDKLEQQPASGGISNVQETKQSKVARSRKRSKKRKSDKSIKASVSNPVKLPPNWQQIRPEKLAEELKASCESNLSPNALTEVVARLKKVSGNSTNTKVYSGSIIKLPANWDKLDDQSLAKDIKTCNKLPSGNPGLTQLLDKLMNSRVPEQSRKDNTTTKHVKLPADWNLSSPGDLADQIRDINCNKSVPAAVIDRLMNKEQEPTIRRSKQHGSSAGPIQLPHDWQHSSSRSLAKKIKSKLRKSANSAWKYSKLLKRLENQRNYQVTKRGKVSPIILPLNWEKSSSKDLVSKFTTNQNLDESSKSKILANLETRPREAKSDTSLAPVRLPHNWESCSAEDLSDAFKNKPFTSQISKVLENFKQSKHDSNYSKLKERSSDGRDRARKRSRSRRELKRKYSPNTKDCPVIKLPENWGSYSSIELASKMNCGKSDLNNLRLNRILANLEKDSQIQAKPSDPKAPIRLPLNWEQTTSQLLAEDIRKLNLNPNTMSRLLENLEKPEQPTLGAQYSKRKDKPDTSSVRPVRLPLNWENCSSEDLGEALKKKSFNSHIFKVLENLKRGNQDSNHSKSKERSSHGRAHARKSAGDREGNLKKVNLKKVRESQPFQLPLSWQNVSAEQLASKLLSKQNEMDGEHSKKLQEVIDKLKIKDGDNKRGREDHIKKKEEHIKHSKNTQKSIRHGDKIRRHNKHHGDGQKKRDDKKNKVVSNEKNSSRKYCAVLQISAEEKKRLLEPFQFGWRRECTFGLTRARLTPEGGFIKEKTRIDVYYWPPSSISRTPILPADKLNAELKKLGARRIKRIQEMKIYLENNDVERKTGLTIENFSFKAKVLDLGEFEFVRHTDRWKDKVQLYELNEPKNDDQSSQVVLSSEDLFGELSDLDDDGNESPDVGTSQLEDGDDTEKPEKDAITPKAVDNIEKPEKDASTPKAVDNIEKPEKETSKLEDRGNNERSEKDVDGDGENSEIPELKENHLAESGTVAGITAKREKRVKLVIKSSELQQSLTCSVKPRRTISKALEAFSSKCEVGMSRLQFCCAGRKLSGGEIASSLEDGVVSVTLVPEDK
eukprot:GFUD01024609.1.p1 GENE.GFUD01024609.1~~GFUD01024609.1.p1  ORF type:complete len:1373 (+),score=413.57 GFUD01024609.1:119-4237(+)